MTFQPAMDITQMSNAGTAVDNALRGLIQQKIYTAVQTGARTTGTITWTTVTEGNLLNILKDLNAAGYSITLASTTITVTWP